MKVSESILLSKNLVVLSTNLDCRSTNNGEARFSIRCSIPESGFVGVFSSAGLGHNS